MTIQTENILSIIGTKGHLSQLSLFLIIFSVSFLLLTLIKKWSHVKAKCEGCSNTQMRKMISRILLNIKYIFLLILSAKIGTLFTVLNPMVEKTIDTLFLIAIFYEVSLFSQNAIIYGFERFFIADDNKKNSTAIGTITLTLKIVIWTIGIIIIFSNLGFKVTTLVASLGISSIAIAFALQSFLKDIFSSFALHFDRPFIENDAINVDGIIGTIRKIGIRSTIIDSIEGEEVIVTNHDLSTKAIKNYSNIKRRRVLMKLPIDLRTPETKLKKITKELEKIIRSQSKAEFKRAHFKEIGEYSYVFEYEYYVVDKDFLVFMETKERINFALLNFLSRNKIKLAIAMKEVRMIK